MKPDYEIITISITREYIEEFKQLQNLVNYLKRHGKKNISISHFFRKWMEESLPEEIEKIEVEQGKKMGLDRLHIDEIHDTDPRSVLEKFIEQKERELGLKD